ncbi:MAG: hydrogen peroxide-inducible genes activator, partial [Bacteroidetes bacterium]
LCDMNIQQFKYVLAVAELRHFEAAAKKCFISQSTLSTMIGRLEGEIGIKIFDRKTKPVTVTQEGAVIIEQLRVILKEIAALENITQELKGELSGDFEIGIIPTIAPYLLPLFLAEFANRYPKVRVIVREMTTPVIQKALRQRDIDLGIAAIPLEDPDLREYFLYDEPFVLYDSKNTKPQKDAVDIKEISFSNLWLLEEEHCLRTQVERICNLSHKQPHRPVNLEFKAGSIDSLVRFTRARKGETLLPHLATLDLPPREKKYLRNFKAPVPIRSVGLIAHRHFVKKGLLEVLRDIIQKAVAPHLPQMAAPEKKRIRPL